ncbi:hypothetical protein QJS66_16985 [Kocuria rhizophila]|nr:hypothetical protein QJS66_16985 [Kocuria rhizophila]
MGGERPAGTFTTRMMVVLFAIVAGSWRCLAAVVVLTMERVATRRSGALGIARTLAVDRWSCPDRGAGRGHRPGDPPRSREGPVQRRGEAVRQSAGTLFVVVTTTRGIRMSHPDPRLSRSEGQHRPRRPGRPASPSPGTPAPWGARSRQGTRAPGTFVVGEVAGGAPSARPCAGQLQRAIASILVMAVLAVALAAGAPALLVRWLRRTTLGLEPEGDGAARPGPGGRALRGGGRGNRHQPAGRVSMPQQGRPGDAGSAGARGGRGRRRPSLHRGGVRRR